MRQARAGSLASGYKARGRSGGKVHATVFAVEQWAKWRRSGLRLRMDSSGGEAGQGFHHQRRAGAGEEIEEVDRGLVRPIRESAGEEWAGIEAFFESMVVLPVKASPMATAH